jgi:polysaccharide deacetylase 2 family uncharacterized protein YibQ
MAAGAGAEPRATVGIIIDDLGNSLADGQRVARLPGPVTCAVLPHTAHSRVIAEAAHRAGKEILLHLPMAASETIEPGPGQLDSHMPDGEVRATLELDLSTVPHAIGVNNHMGSLLTAQTPAMDRLMRELAARRLLFVDSRTHAASVAAARARAHGIPTLERDVFLDREPAENAVLKQLARLERIAHRRGYALAIGHPYPATLAALERWLPQLAARGLRLVPLTTRLASRQETKPWHASWSP